MGRRVIFVEGGGHNCLGAFVEDGLPALFERMAPFAVSMACTGLMRHRSFGRRARVRQGGGVDGLAEAGDRVTGRATCTGEGGALARLSILGSELEHHAADLTIRRADDNAMTLLPQPAARVDGRTMPETLAIELDLFAPLYDAFVAAIDCGIDRAAVVTLSFRLDGAPGVLAEWDVPADQPRLIKLYIGTEDGDVPRYLPAGLDAFDGRVPGDFALEVAQPLDAPARAPGA